MNPHLFTHLFHEGVIVSTRKLVYDAGSNEESIKSLMQAQHKAVMKDLRRGAFDDKIDQYLAGTPGLEPRSGADPAAPMPRGTRAQTEESPPPDEVIAEAKAAQAQAQAQAQPDVQAGAGASISGGSPIEIVNEDLSEPIELPLKPRTKTAERTSPAGGRQPPPPQPDDAPTLIGSSAGDVAAAISAANAGARPGARAATPPPVPQRSPNPRDSNPIIEISVDEEEIDERLRGPRDTAVSMAAEVGDGIPSRTGADSVPPQTIPVRQGQRPASHGAAALPPMKSPTRPSVQPPVVTTRSASGNDDLSAPVEIHAPAPPSVEPPPGERAERPGQYSVSRKDATAPMREKTGRIAALGNPAPVPAGLGPRPATPPQREPTPSPVGNRGVPPPANPRAPTPGSGRIPQPVPARVHVTAPISNRTPSPSPPTQGSGVVMTRPAVIVGAPPKTPVAGAQPKVRKAREDEGRGFGQGLISEKSLDEVILAYLSEDAEDK